MTEEFVIKETIRCNLDYVYRVMTENKEEVLQKFFEDIRGSQSRGNMHNIDYISLRVNGEEV